MPSDYDEFDQRDEFEERPRDDRVIERAKDALRAPAILMIICGICGVLFSAFWLYAVTQPSFDTGWDNGVAAQMNDPNKTPAEKKDLKEMTDDLKQPFKDGMLFCSLASVAINLLMMLAGILMMNLKARAMCVLASVLSMIPLANCCFIVGVPIGIWCLVALGRPDVKAGFRAAAR